MKLGIHEGRRAIQENLHMPDITRLRPKRPVEAKKIAYGALGVAGVAAAGALFVLKGPMFAIEQVHINAVTQTDTAPALRAAGVVVDGPIVTVKESRAERALEKLPTVISAEVERDWPHDVTVNVVERRPIAMAPTTDGRWARIGEGGVVMEVVPRPEAGLPVPLGVVATPQLGSVLDGPSKALAEVAGIMPPSLRSKVSQVVRDEQGLRLVLNGGTVVNMGDDTAVPDKLLAAATVASKVDLAKTASIDVTLPSLPLATPRA